MSLSLSAHLPERDVQVDLEVADGETVALLGPNGAGKSTLLAIAAGLLRPQDGRVTLDDRTLTHVEAGRTRAWVPPHARQVALLAQDPLLFPHLSVRHNIAFGPRSRGASRRTAALEADRWLDRIGLPDLGGRRPSAVSGGQAQRVAVARALAAEPRLLLLDEPMAALDVDVTPALRHLLREVLADRTVVIATHDVLDALLLADRVVVLDGGRVVEHGPTREVLSRPRSAFAARIAGLNITPGTWSADDDAVRTTAGDLVHGRLHDDGGGAEPADRAVPVTGTPMVAAFRPATVSVFPARATGSPRNSWPVTVTALEPQGDLVRVRAGRLSADITPQAAADLAITPGDEVWFTVKATEVDLYPA
ncbi:sulfate/molybdate ABC transporter ATP-binding protein [Promicromonospora sukumoe]|uniref:sulfate/molybdate ABC transporter ATP-binding protein n=1 Tax=Promicromonospora sukumoe TaxID=88382 RepID=UPI0003826528|nr:ABC transporter ATP-binding protein [Promicromonospora sukumoe]